MRETRIRAGVSTPPSSPSDDDNDDGDETALQLLCNCSATALEREGGGGGDLRGVFAYAVQVESSFIVYPLGMMDVHSSAAIFNCFNSAQY